MSPPLFSIVTAVRDGLSLLRVTALSVLAQTEHRWEWIVVDDASSEPVADFLRSLKESRIRVVRNERNLGQAESLNVGLRRARADWVVRIDADDLARPDRLRQTAHAIALTPRAELVFSDFNVIDEVGKHLSTVRFRHPVGDRFFKHLYARNNPICHSSVAFKRLTADGIAHLYDGKKRLNEDWDLWRRILRERGPEAFVHVPELLAEYRIVQTSKSSLAGRAQAAEGYAMLGRDRGRANAGSIRETHRSAQTAYRILFYRAVSEGRAGFWSPLDVRLLRQTLSEPGLRARAAVLFAFRGPKSLLKRALWRGVYR